ncbi:MAG: excisionase family DNA-binding protein [Candidatus Dadabacteria bacterium]|nr:excisionase family DNA-binding protein [Candidatus Dadabacteria bacterium]
MEGYIGIHELSKYLNVKKKTAYHFVATLDIPHYRVGRLIRFKLSEVEEWMTNNRSQLKIPYKKVANL